MTVRCRCGRAARVIWWAKSAGWFNPSCEVCPAVDTAGEMVYLTGDC